MLKRVVLLYFHSQLQALKELRLVIHDGLVVSESSRGRPTAFFVIRLIRPEVIALCLVLVLVLIFVGAVGIVKRFVSGIVIGITLRPHAIQTVHVRQVRLIDHDEHVKRCHTD